MKEGWFRRRYMWYLNRDRVKELQSKREGSCVRCGACCRNCLFYNEEEGYCRIYKYRPRICREYPLTPEDRKTTPRCGYRFRE